MKKKALKRVRMSRNRQIVEYQLYKGNNQLYTFMKAETLEGLVPWDFIMCFYCNFPLTAASVKPLVKIGSTFYYGVSVLDWLTKGNMDT